MNNILFYVLLALLAVSVAYLARPDGTIVKFIKSKANEIEILKGIAKTILGEEIYNEILELLDNAVSDKEKDIIMKHNGKYGTKFNTIEDVAIDSILRKINIGGKTYITAAQAHQAVTLIKKVIEFETKK